MRFEGFFVSLPARESQGRFQFICKLAKSCCPSKRNDTPLQVRLNTGRSWGGLHLLPELRRGEVSGKTLTDKSLVKPTQSLTPVVTACIQARGCEGIAIPFSSVGKLRHRRDTMSDLGGGKKKKALAFPVSASTAAPPVFLEAQPSLSAPTLHLACL